MFVIHLFNFVGREFYDLIPSKVKKLILKFVEIDGRENPSDEDCHVLYLCICFVFTNSFSRKNLLVS